MKLTFADAVADVCKENAIRDIAGDIAARLKRDGADVVITDMSRHAPDLYKQLMSVVETRLIADDFSMFSDGEVLDIACELLAKEQDFLGRSDDAKLYRLLGDESVGFVRQYQPA